MIPPVKGRCQLKLDKVVKGLSIGLPYMSDDLPTMPAEHFEIYPVRAIIRNCVGSMTRKLSVT